MIILDASAMLELLLDTDLAPRVRRSVGGGPLAAPYLLDVEVAHVLRRFVRSGDVSAQRAHMALIDLADLPMTRYSHVPLLERIWDLRENFTGYDATYIALSEVLDAVLVTCDAKLARVGGHRAAIDLIDPTG